MSTRIRINNLGRSLSITALHELFAAHGAVENVKLVSRNQSRPCVGYVTMSDAPAAEAAIAALNGSTNDGLVMTLHEMQRPMMRRQREPSNNGNGRSNDGNGRSGGARQPVRRASTGHEDEG